MLIKSIREHKPSRKKVPEQKTNISTVAMSYKNHKHDLSHKVFHSLSLHCHSNNMLQCN